MESQQTLLGIGHDQADVVIDNFSVGVLDRWGIGYETVSKTNPRVIYVQMSGMGEGGPWSNFVTYAPTIHALAGLTYLTGVPGRQDIGIGFSYNDHQAGLHGCFAILAALETRHRTHQGQRIEVSQFEVGVNFAGPALMDFLPIKTVQSLPATSTLMMSLPPMVPIAAHPWQSPALLKKDGSRLPA